MRKRRKFGQEFRFEAVRMVVEQGRDRHEVCDDLEICTDMLRRWIKKYESDGMDAFPGSGRQKPEDEETRRLRREVERLRMERDISRKCGRDLFGPAPVRYAFIDRHRHLYPVLVMCDVLEVSSSGYYAWRGRPESRRSREDRELKKKIRSVFEKSHQTLHDPRYHRRRKEQVRYLGSSHGVTSSISLLRRHEI